MEQSRYTKDCGSTQMGVLIFLNIIACLVCEFSAIIFVPTLIIFTIIAIKLREKRRFNFIQVFLTQSPDEAQIQLAQKEIEELIKLY